MAKVVMELPSLQDSCSFTTSLCCLGRGKMQSDSKLRRLEQNSNAMEKSLMKWTEGVPSFTPTYKYRPGTGKYDLRGTPWDPNSKGGKMRCPSWCDRILWRAPQDYVVQHTYKDCAALVHSDHRYDSAVYIVRSHTVPFKNVEHFS